MNAWFACSRTAPLKTPAALSGLLFEIIREPDKLFRLTTCWTCRVRQGGGKEKRVQRSETIVGVSFHGWGTQRQQLEMKRQRLGWRKKKPAWGNTAVNEMWAGQSLIHHSSSRSRQTGQTSTHRIVWHPTRIVRTILCFLAVCSVFISYKVFVCSPFHLTLFYFRSGATSGRISGIVAPLGRRWPPNSTQRRHRQRRHIATHRIFTASPY